MTFDKVKNRIKNRLLRLADGRRPERKTILAVTLALAILAGIHAVSPIQEVQPVFAAGDVSRPPDPSKGEGPFTDGVYEGSADAYNGPLTMSVTVQQGWITALALRETTDDAEYVEKVKTPLLTRVLEAQSTAVDGVSGATFTSYGMLDAIDQALAGAKGGGH